MIAVDEIRIQLNEIETVIRREREKPQLIDRAASPSILRLRIRGVL
jgi:hypothetical protein